MGKAFISYSHKDMEIVKEVNRLLSQEHVLTWFDQKSIRAGDQWEVNIATSIFSCDVFIMFYSKGYRDSYYCQKEYEIYKQKKNPTPLIVVGLDDARHSFFATDATAYQFIDYDYESGTPQDIANSLLSCPPIAHCKILTELQDAGSATDFLNALQNLQRPKHYDVIEPLIRFLLWLKGKKAEGKYISPCANFSSLVAHSQQNQSFSLSLAGEDDLSSTYDSVAEADFLRNLFYALFKFGRVEFTRPAPQVLAFESLFVNGTHRFLQTGKDATLSSQIYADFNQKLAALYQTLPPLNEFISALNEVYNASKFFETQELRFISERQLDYEVNPFVLSLAKKMYFTETQIGQNYTEECFPLLRAEDTAAIVAADSLEQPSGQRQAANGVTLESLRALQNPTCTAQPNLILRGDYGSGKTALLRAWCVKDPYSLYVDLTDPVALHGDAMIRSVIEGQNLTSYKINFHSLCSYSTCQKTITLLVDNIDNLSQENRKKALSELVRYSDVFRIVVTSSKHNLEDKISLNRDGDSFSTFHRYTLCALSPAQIIEYLRFSLTSREEDPTAAIKSLQSLSLDDPFFAIFNNFTKLDILMASVPSWQDFTVKNISEQFNSRIRVYRNIFESECDYSIPKKIASLFRESVVSIEDVIVKLVLHEIGILKKVSFESCQTETCSIENEKLRFRDFYPVLTKIMGKYAFLNEDIRSYFAASYIATCVQQAPGDFDALEALLAPVKDNYLVLKYLAEFNLLATIDLEYLLTEEQDRLSLIYVLYKILQYETDEVVRTEFLQNANFTTLPDKLFMGAENVVKIVVPPCVEQVGRATFSNMPLLRSIDFAPRGVANRAKKPLAVKPWAILNCPALTTIRFGANYQTYNHPLFSRCFGLNKIEIDPQNPAFTTLQNGQLLTSKDETVLYCAVNSLSGELVLPETLQKLECNSLSYLKNVTAVYIPPAAREIDTNFTDFCDNLQRITVDPQNPVFYSDENGLMFTQTEKGKTLFRAPSGQREDLVIPSDVAVIGSDSISCCSWVKNIFVPKSVKVVENYAFADTYSLKSLTFEDISAVEEFGNYIFLSTKETAKVYGDGEYTLKEFHANFCKPLGTHKLRGVVRKPITAKAFTDRGFEVLNQGVIPQTVQNAVIARDVTLFSDAVYRPQDFNILIIGLTEYNAILTKTPLQAEAYVKDLITKNNVSMVVFSRDLPCVTIFERAKEYENLFIVRTKRSSSSATALLAEIIKELGER